MKKQPKQNTSNIGKGLEWEKELKTFYNGLDGDYNKEREQALVDKVQSLIQSTKEETIKEIMGIIDSNKLPYPNPYGQWVSVKNCNRILNELLSKIKELKKR